MLCFEGLGVLEVGKSTLALRLPISDLSLVIVRPAGRWKSPREAPDIEKKGLQANPARQESRKKAVFEAGNFINLY